MATGEESIDKVLSRFCKDGLLRTEFKKTCQKFLTEIKVPAKWKDRTANRLEQDHETYKHREKLLRRFVVIKEKERFKLSRSSKKQFFEELESFSNSAESNNAFCDQGDKSSPWPTIYNLDDQDDVKLQGVVVRKTDKNAWVLVEKKPVHVPSGKRAFELIFDLQACDEGLVSTGFPLKVGDIVEVTEYKRETTALEPADVIWYVK